MSVNSLNTFLNIRDAHLRVVSGNVHATAMNIGGINVDVAHGLQSVTNQGNVTSNTLEFSNATTAFVTTANATVGRDLTVTGNVLVSSNLTVTGNVTVSDDLTVTENLLVSNNLTVTKDVTLSSNINVVGNVTAGFLYGDVSNVTNIVSNLHQIVENGNVTSNTVQFSNAKTGFVTTSNVEVGGNINSAGIMTNQNYLFFATGPASAMLQPGVAGGNDLVANFSRIEFILGSGFDTSTKTYTIPCSGYWEFSYCLLARNVATGVHWVMGRWLINGALYDNRSFVYFTGQGGGSQESNLIGKIIGYYTAGTTISVRISQNSDGTDVYMSSNYSHFFGKLLH